jgi:hypothetical protein
MDGIRIFRSMVLLCRMLMRIWMKTMWKYLSIKENIIMWQWSNFRVINFNIKTLMALHCFRVVDWGNNTLWMLMWLSNKIAWGICAWNKKNFMQISIKAFMMPLLQVIITLLPLDRGSFCHLLSQEFHVTWFRIIKMPWQFIDGHVAWMCLLNSLTIPNGLRSRERYCPDNNFKINRIW